MSDEVSVQPVRLLPIDQIEVLNTRERNGRAFAEIVTNIKTIGLKKPIVVTPRPKPDGTEHYLLICGEGRLNAFRTLGEREIPALVVTASDEDAFIMSLSENIARRQCRPLELLAGVEELRTRGYNAKQIAACNNSSWTRTSRTYFAPRDWRLCRSSSTSASGPRGGGHDRRLARLQAGTHSAEARSSAAVSQSADRPACLQKVQADPSFHR
ncbi:MAG: ParB N-terminal domain-containing protein [Ideonella sp.]|nr:ParB N-terminal domain-containing protein [Ideonella sp.]